MTANLWVIDNKKMFIFYVSDLMILLTNKNVFLFCFESINILLYHQEKKN